MYRPSTEQAVPTTTPTQQTLASQLADIGRKERSGKKGMTVGAMRRIEADPQESSMRLPVKDVTEQGIVREDIRKAGTRMEVDRSGDQTMGKVWWTGKPVCYICQERTLLDFFVVHFCQVDDYHLHGRPGWIAICNNCRAKLECTMPTKVRCEECADPMEDCDAVFMDLSAFRKASHNF